MSSALKQALSYPKFRGEKLTILTWTKGTLVIEECKAALRKMGHTVVQLDLLAGSEPPIKVLLTALLQTKPDFVLSINHNGFDANGEIGAILDQFEIPICVWYVDSPLFNIKDHPFPAPNVTTIMSWEKTLIPHIKEAYGVDDVHYMPLATHTDWFHPRQQSVNHQTVFVGDSMAYALKKWRGLLKGRNRHTAEKLASKMLGTARTEALNWQFPKHTNTGTLSERWDTVTAATWIASAKYRNSLLKAIEHNGITIYGDTAWRKILPKSDCRPPITYGAELSIIYNKSQICINMTSLQMPTAVNQRVFDVPASGGFLLADEQADVFEHFEKGTEVMTYETAEHLEDLIKYYRKHDEERTTIINRARARVLNEHTYVHRTTRLMDLMRIRYGMAKRGGTQTFKDASVEEASMDNNG